ncbi:LOW QUALITY PROTEIN: protein SRC2-like [Phalaenopsis equestris]|uniref:LOW QUALITY PROTEIN: protein SRC2-like n=1 Tax=Phalaenopsis equestris TaxID=78828 RepID=UPI0009E2D7EC|nr:LOW QUALITY PROTEIN: protein SRC2-like [Phalaenopsis equestris]
MAYRTLELTLISAKDLREVNVFSKMTVYALATIAGDRRTQQRTPADHNGGKNPSWNTTLRFPVPADPAASNNLVVHVLLRCERTLGDRDVGEVHIPVKELLDGIKEGSKFVSYQVRKPGSGKAKGVLNLSYKFVDLPVTSAPAPAAKPAEGFSAYPPSAPPREGDPVMAYPAAGASGSAYPPSYPPAGGYPPHQPHGNYAPYPPPPQGNYGYGAPPQAGYGYGAPQGYGYGAPPQQGYGYGAAPPRKNKNNMALGLGAGLLGGLLVGDMISDVGDYDAGYDAGFDDGFGF